MNYPDNYPGFYNLNIYSLTAIIPQKIDVSQESCLTSKGLSRHPSETPRSTKKYKIKAPVSMSTCEQLRR